MLKLFLVSVATGVFLGLYAYVTFLAMNEPGWV